MKTSCMFDVEALKAERDAYQSLASVFLVLPDKGTVEALRPLAEDSFGECDGGSSFDVLVAFAREVQDRDAEDVVEDIARERVVLLRGTGMGPLRPPYESLYVNAKQNESMGSLNLFYGECGMEKLADIHDTADYLGVELSFVAELLGRVISQVEAGENDEASRTNDLVDSFMSQHLARWAGTYADAALQNAKTGYWRAVMLMIRETIGLRAE